MKRLMTAACTIFTALLHGFGQTESATIRPDNSRIGIDLTSGICFETIRITAGHSFNPHWSIGADISLDMNVMKKYRNKTETEHIGTLSDNAQEISSEKFRRTFQDIFIYVDYWPVTAFKGPHIYLGGIFQDRDRQDIILGAGYSIHIWKGLNADIMYGFGLIDTYKNKQMPVEGIRTCFYYDF